MNTIKVTIKGMIVVLPPCPMCVMNLLSRAWPTIEGERVMVGVPVGSMGEVEKMESGVGAMAKEHL